MYMMGQKSFSILLEECLQRLDQGESLPDLLVEFPDKADQLKPLLLVAMASRAFPIPVPSQTAQRLGRNQMLAEMNQLEIKKAFRKNAAIPAVSRMIGSLARAIRAGGFTRLAYSYRLASVALVLILSGGYFTLSASASSQPGDLLYVVKLSMQQAGLSLIYSDPTSIAVDHTSSTAYTPWKFGQVVWALEGITGGYQTDEEGEFFTTDPDDLNEQAKDLREAAREAAQELKDERKETAEAAREAAQELKEEGQETAEAAREAAQDLKEEGQETAEAAREEAQDLKEEEKEAAEADKEEEQEAAEADKEDEQEIKETDKEEDQETKETDKETKKADKEAEKNEKESLKDNKKNK
jgi:hypothetical protein